MPFNVFWMIFHTTTGDLKYSSALRNVRVQKKDQCPKKQGIQISYQILITHQWHRYSQFAQNLSLQKLSKRVITSSLPTCFPKNCKVVFTLCYYCTKYVFQRIFLQVLRYPLRLQMQLFKFNHPEFS